MPIFTCSENKELSILGKDTHIRRAGTGHADVTQHAPFSTVVVVAADGDCNGVCYPVHEGCTLALSLRSCMHFPKLRFGMATEPQLLRESVHSALCGPGALEECCMRFQARSSTMPQTMSRNSCRATPPTNFAWHVPQQMQAEFGELAGRHAIGQAGLLFLWSATCTTASDHGRPSKWVAEVGRAYGRFQMAHTRLFECISSVLLERMLVAEAARLERRSNHAIRTLLVVQHDRRAPYQHKDNHTPDQISGDGVAGEDEDSWICSACGGWDSCEGAGTGMAA